MGEEERIKELEDLISNSQYNKRTQHAIGLYKAQLAKLKEKIEKKQTGTGGGGEGYAVRKTGDGTVLLLGFPSVGKSTLLNRLTNQDSEIGSYDFTTLDVVPGLLEYKHAKIQILDVPGVVQGAASGKGRGKEVLSVVRSADLVINLLDVHNPEHKEVLQKEIRDAHIRVNEKKPDVKIKKKAKDGISIASTVKLDINKQTLKDVLKEFRMMNADVVIRDKITVDQFIDCIEANKKYIPGITVVNKKDTVSKKRLKEVMKKTQADLAISAQEEDGLEELKELIFKKLDLIRIYMKEPRKDADMEEPLIIKRRSTIKNICEKLHKDMVKNFRFARVTGPSAKFPEQKLSLPHTVKDKDIVELHME